MKLLSLLFLCCSHCCRYCVLFMVWVHAATLMWALVADLTPHVLLKDVQKLLSSMDACHTAWQSHTGSMFDRFWTCFWRMFCLLPLFEHGPPRLWSRQGICVSSANKLCWPCEKSLSVRGDDVLHDVACLQEDQLPCKAFCNRCLGRVLQAASYYTSLDSFVRWIHLRQLSKCQGDCDNVLQVGVEVWSVPFWHSSSHKWLWRII